MEEQTPVTENIIESDSDEEHTELEIAVIGMAGRFPGAKTIDAFWENLCNGVEAITFFSDEEMLAAGVPPEAMSAPNYVKAAALLEDAERFDANFFGISAREAELTDPQHRIFLECIWQALEHAGYTPQAYNGNIGVFAGASTNGYALNLLSNEALKNTLDEQQITLGTNLYSLSTQASYKLNLHGPSLNVQTACSTSLVAVHLACQSLLSYQCDIALAGAVSVRVPQRTGYFYQKDGIVSPDGHCRAFDEQAQGTIFGSGAGVVVLKRLNEALGDGDTIHAVIKGSALNNDGAMKVSYTAPSLDGQTEALLLAQGLANVAAETIGYIEAHGTGTAMGDPIEVTALMQAFQQSTDKKQFCALGSVKSNIGHLDAAAGIASLIKTILMLEHKMLPPSIHCTHPNSNIDWINSQFYVNTSLKPWAEASQPRRAGVSAFGFGGTNAHCILEEAPARPPSETSRPFQLLTLSARTPSALHQATKRLAAAIEQADSTSLADIAFTLQMGRQSFPYRRALVCQDRDTALSSLQMLGDQDTITEPPDPDAEFSIVFLLPGQGSQYVNMTRDLYQHEPEFRAIIDRCAEQLQIELDLDLRDVLYPPDEQLTWATHLLQQTRIAQPALFSVEFALAQLWRSWGIHPTALLGHSIGEIVAACLAGVMPLEQALLLVALRGRIVQKQPEGAMLSVSLPYEAVRGIARDFSVEIAAVNSPRQCVLSGSISAIEGLEAHLKTVDVATHRLQTSHAFHSRMVEPAVPLLIDAMAQLTLSPPSIPFISNVTGTWITKADAIDPQYWGKQLHSPVYFSAGVGQILQDSGLVVLEVGPGNSLSKLVRQQAGPRELTITASLDSAFPNERETMLNALGKLWTAGLSIDWQSYWSVEQRRRVPLPTYSFEGQPFWVERGTAFPTLASGSSQIQKNPDITDWFYLPSWKREDHYSPVHSTTPQNWLILADEIGIGSQLAHDLQAQGQHVVMARQGEHFEQINDQAFVLNTARPDDFRQVLKLLRERDQLPQGIVYLWSIDPASRPFATKEHLLNIQETGFYTFLQQLQTLVKTNWFSQLSIFLVTSQLYEVVGKEIVHPEFAPMQALRLIVGQEQPGFVCRTIDISAPMQETLEVAQITRELLTPGEAMAVALRGRHRWVETFNKVALDEIAPQISTNGFYLILGGLGNLGLLIAQELVKTFNAKVILLDKRNLAEQALTAQQTIIDELIQATAALSVVQTDITDLTAMQQTLADAGSRWGDLLGVIHAAGTSTPPKSIIEVSPEDFQEELFPHIQGLMVLEEALAEHTPDFCLIVSSLASILGGLGHSTYAATTLFTDSFVQAHNQHSRVQWTSVNWETWNLNDSQHQEQARIGLQRLQLSMNMQETISTFKRTLALTQASQIAISSGDLSARMRQWVLGATSQQGPRSGATGARPDLRSSYAPPRNEAEAQIAQIYSELLGIQSVGIHDSFFELGGDSLLAVQFVARLRTLFSQEISLRIFFEAPTVAELATVLTSKSEFELPIEQIEQLLQEVEQLSSDTALHLLQQESKASEENPTHE